MNYLSSETKNEITYVTLDNLKEYNTLSFQLMKELNTHLQNIGERKDVKVVVIKGSDKVFSAGHSLKEIQDGNQQEVNHLFRTCYNLMHTIRQIPQVVVSKVRGVAVAAGT